MTVPPGFPRGADTTQLQECRAPCIFRAHPGADAVLCVQLDVGLNLVGEVPFVLRAAENASHAKRPYPQRPHDVPFAEARNRPRISVVRCHSADARLSRFLPARVSEKNLAFRLLSDVPHSDRM